MLEVLRAGKSTNAGRIPAPVRITDANGERGPEIRQSKHGGIRGVASGPAALEQRADSGQVQSESTTGRSTIPAVQADVQSQGVWPESCSGAACQVQGNVMAARGRVDSPPGRLQSLGKF
jgi:hypothetical protein